MPITVPLSKDEVRRCSQLALERWVEKLDSKDKPTYAVGAEAGYLEHDLLADIRANLAEWAVAKHYGLSWNGGFTYPNTEHNRRKVIADVGVNIEVRNRRKGDGTPVWDYDLVKGQTLVACEVPDIKKPREVIILGWLPMDECGNDEWKFVQNGKTRYYVPSDALNHPDTL
jgi:hypothetical protein